MSTYSETVSPTTLTENGNHIIIIAHFPQLVGNVHMIMYHEIRKRAIACFLFFCFFFFGSLRQPRLICSLALIRNSQADRLTIGSSVF